MPTGSRSRTHSLQQKDGAATNTPTIVLASNGTCNDDRRRTGGRILRHVRSTIVSSSQSKAHLSAANKPSTLQSCSSPPLSRMSSRVGTGGGGGVIEAASVMSAVGSRKEDSSRLRTISASATPLSAIRARSSIFTPKRWSNFLRPSQADIATTSVSATCTPQKKESSPAPSPGPSISLPFNVCAAEGSALMNAVNQTKAKSLYPTNSNFEIGMCIYSDTLRRPKANVVQDAIDSKERRTGVDKAGIRSWLLETNNATSAQSRTEEESTVKPFSIAADNAEQSVYVIAPEHSIYSDDLSFSTCPTPVLDSSPNTQTAGSTPDLRGNSSSGAGEDVSSPTSPAAHFASLSNTSTTNDVSAWGSHPEGLCINDDELSHKLRSLLRRQPEECEKPSRLRMRAIDGCEIGQQQHNTRHSRLRNKISVADFLGVARQASTPTAACDANDPSTADLIDRPISIVSESICGHEEDVVIRTAWRANFSQQAASQAQEQRKGRPGRSGKRLTLHPSATPYGREADVWEDCKTPRQRSLGKGRNSSCPPSPTTTTTIGSGDGDAGSSARITPVRSMTVPNSNTMSTLFFEDERESFDLCEHLLERAQQHRRYAIHE